MQLFRHRLDPDADERRQHSRRVTGGDFLGYRLRVAVLFGVGPDAVAVFEVDAEVLDRLARELVDDPRADRSGEPGLVGRKRERAGERTGVRRVLVENRARDRADLRRRISLEEVRAAIQAVHGLAIAALSRICAAGGGVGLAKARNNWRQRPRAQ